MVNKEKEKHQKNDIVFLTDALTKVKHVNNETFKRTLLLEKKIHENKIAIENKTKNDKINKWSVGLNIAILIISVVLTGYFNGLLYTTNSTGNVIFAQGNNISSNSLDITQTEIQLKHIKKNLDRINACDTNSSTFLNETAAKYILLENEFVLGGDIELNISNLIILTNNALNEFCDNKNMYDVIDTETRFTGYLISSASSPILVQNQKMKQYGLLGILVALIICIIFRKR